MDVVRAVVLGVVQGVTEFLPISSDGHLLLARNLFGWADEGLAFDAALHIGTFLALLVAFRVTWLQLLRGKNWPLLRAIIVGTIPAALVGFFGESLIATSLRGMLVTGIGFFCSALVLLFAEKFHPRTDVEESQGVLWKHALWIGIAQIFALLPGLSRSGVTMSAGMLQGFSRLQAVEFSFLLALPITAGASLEGLRLLLMQNSSALLPVFAGVVTAFLVGWASIVFLLRTVRARSFTPYVVYLVLVAGLTLLLS